MISKAKKVIPSSCCVYNTLFTYMGIIGKMNEENKEVTKYIDKKNNITVLLNIRFSKKVEKRIIILI